MLQLFRNKQQVVVAILLVYTLVLRMETLLHPPLPYTENGGIFSRYILERLAGQPLLMSGLALLLTFIQGLLLNRMVITHRITREMNYIPAMSYTLLLSCSPKFSALSPMLMGNTFVIIALFSLFSSYKSRSVMADLFDFSFWIGMASLFYYSYSVYLLLGLLALPILRPNDIKETLGLLSGYFSLYLITLVVWFLYDELGKNFHTYIGSNYQLMPLSGVLGWPEIAQMGIVAFVIIWSIIRFTSFSARTSVQTQLFQRVVYAMMFISALSLLSQQSITVEHLILSSVPLALFLAMTLQDIRKPLLAEFLHIILFMGAIAYQYQVYFFK